jgi:small subunit ribosomal protein S16
MATVIRLTRMGRKKKPFYRVVVTDSRNARDSKPTEFIGYYNPMTEPSTVEINEERLNYWISVGAKMSDRVKKLAGK